MGSPMSGFALVDDDLGRSASPEKEAPVEQKTSERASSSTASDESYSMPEDNRIVTLQVCARRFTTTIGTLTSGSEFFAAFFNKPNNWDDKFERYINYSYNSKLPPATKPFMKLQDDGSYFLDADPAHFDHVLNYLRIQQFPLLYSKHSGHDYAFYYGVMLEARRFQVLRLFHWIHTGQYNHCITITRETSTNTYSDRSFSYPGGDYQSHEDEEVHSQWATEKMYLCPRRIDVHRGRPDYCGRACENSRAQLGGRFDFEDNPVLKTLTVLKTTQFTPQM